jgi:glucose/arabinose dehydrogenase
MKHLINYVFDFFDVIEGFLAVLILVMLFLLFDSMLENKMAESIPISQCKDEVCSDPVIKDPNLKVELILTELNAPSNMVFLGNNDILYLERYTGQIKRIVNETIQPDPLADTNIASGAGERGMMGIAVSKNAANVFIFIYYTESEYDGGTPIGNRLYRYELLENKLVNPKLLLDLPFSPGPNHNGGSIVIGPDNHVYLTIGDLDNVTDKSRPNTIMQNALNGEEPNGSGGILRITQDGQAVQEGILGNTFPLNLYYGYGIRNSFGIDFDPITGKLWDTENGPNYGDEINLVEPGFNSGWKKVQGIWKLRGSNIGKEVGNNPEGLVLFDGKGKYSVPEFSWKGRYGPTSIKFLESANLGTEYENDLFVGDFHNGTIYNFDLNKTRTGLSLQGLLTDGVANNSQELESVVFASGFGGITDIEVGQDGYLYVLSYIQRSIYRIVPVVQGN